MNIDDIQRIPVTGRAQWLGLRKRDVTASDIGAVCGIHPIASALSVWAEKTGRITVEENNVMRRGRWLESGVIDAVAETHPDWVITRPRCYVRSPSLRMGATPDAWVATGKGSAHQIFNMQCKVVSRTVFERDWAEGPPLYYQLQAMQEAVLSGMTQTKLAALVISEFTADLEVVDVPLNAAAWGRCVETVARFWQLVDAGGQPAPDYGKDADVIGALFRSMPGGEPRDLTGDNRMTQVCAEYCRLGAEIKALEAQREPYKGEILDKLGGSPKATVSGFKVSNTHIHAEVKAHVRDYDRLTVSAVKA